MSEFNCGFQVQDQLARNWCWAAVGASVAQTQQFKIAQKELGANGCNANPVPKPCNQPYWLDAALTDLHRLKSTTQGPLSFQQVKDQFASVPSLPICARIDWAVVVLTTSLSWASTLREPGPMS